MSATTDEVTRLLERVNHGDSGAYPPLLELIYDELHVLAASFMRRERPDHTLQPTALVNEAFMKLVDQTSATWESRGHFMAIAATAMRRILVNHARDRGRLKRGGERRRIELDEAIDLAAAEPVDLIDLDEALAKLETTDARKVRIVEMRFFLGQSVDETAGLLNISPATVKRDWEFARAWLLRELTRDENADG